MKRIIHTFSCYVFLLGFAVVPVVCSASTIKETQDSIHKIEAQKKAKQNALSDAKKQHEKALAAVKEIDLKIAAEHQRMQKLLAEVGATEEKLSAQQENIRLLQEKRQQAIDALNQDLVRAYRAHREPWIKSVLSSQDYSETQRILKWIGILQSAQKNHADDYLSSVKELEDAQLELEATKEALISQQRESEAHQEEFKELRKKQLEKAESFKKSLAQSKSELSHLESDGRALKNLLAQLKKKQAQTKVSSSSSSKRPLASSDWPVNGELEHQFGDSRESGKLKWQGWYIKAPRGKPVRAVADGKVIFSNWLQGFGMLVIVDHGADYHTLYAHADALGVAEGTKVKKGEVIAYTGSSGGAEIPGIYFEVRHQGQPINPQKWLKRA